MAGCYDCGLPYQDDGWIEANIPDEIWKAISPTGDDGGLLCVTCMARRLKKAGFEDVPVQFCGAEPFEIKREKELSIMNALLFKLERIERLLLEQAEERERIRETAKRVVFSIMIPSLIAAISYIFFFVYMLFAT